MADYYVNNNAQANGDHEVHKEKCLFMPKAVNRTYLGNYYNCKEAVESAKTIFPQSNGCFYCSKDCHSS